nr:hypothetical protein [uncultured Flavobacterium sp.]
MKKHGVQVRGGWSCASTFAHSLFDVSAEDSKAIIKKILGKYFSQKSGWVYRSLHSTTSDEDILFICGAV